MTTTKRKQPSRMLVTTDNDGCEVNPIPWGCLTCPLEVCRYDLPAPEQARLNTGTRDRDIALAWEHGEPARSIAARTGLSERTVHRAIQHATEEVRR